MKRLLLLAFLVTALVPARSMEASTFTLESIRVDLHTADPGLVLFADHLLGGYTFNLDTVGQERTAVLFRLGTRETALNPDDLRPYSIGVGFNFTAPPPSFGGAAEGITGAAWLGRSFGYVLWDNPLTLSFGNTGLLGVSLSHETFGLPGSANVDATFRLLRADTAAPPVASVPEPSSMLLMALGALGFAVHRRRSV